MTEVSISSLLCEASGRLLVCVPYVWLRVCLSVWRVWCSMLMLWALCGNRQALGRKWFLVGMFLVLTSVTMLVLE